MPGMTIGNLKQEATTAADTLWASPPIVRPPANPLQAQTAAGLPSTKQRGTVPLVKPIAATRLPPTKQRVAVPLAKPIAATRLPPMRIGRSVAQENILRDNPESKALQARFAAAGITLPDQKPNNPDEWGYYHRNYAEMVMKEAKQKFADHILNRNSPTGTPVSDEDLQDAANHWLAGVRMHEEWKKNHGLDTDFSFRDKPRGHGQEAGSTDGRLLRKLMMASAEDAASNDPSFNSYRNDIKAARDRLNAATIARNGNPGDADTQQEYRDAEQNLFNQNKALNEDVATKLGNLRSMPGGSLALKKAIFLTQEKLRDPLGYKQRYARLVPFGNGFVKASRRFYTPASAPLSLPSRTSDGTARTNTLVNMGEPPHGLPNFGDPRKELIEDVGQRDLGECWLQASAASLPHSTLGNMFSWKPSHGSEGVTTRLHDENGKPIYIRTAKNMLWDADPDLEKRVFDHKALWPAALATAAAKVGRDDLRQFRDWEKPRDPATGLPVYSVRDVYGNSIAAAAKLLTGKAPIIDESIAGLSNRDKISLLAKAWEYAKKARIERGVASIGNFDNPKKSDDGPEHAVTWFLSNNPNSKEELFGNPWDHLTKVKHGTVGGGRKMFNADLSKVNRLSVLNPNVTAPSTSEFIWKRSQPRQRRLLGNIPI